MKSLSNNRGLLAILIILLVVAADQLLKIWVKTNFYLGEDYPLTSWFHLKFIENNGIAFGIEFTGKIFLTLGRLVAVGLLIWLITLVRRAPGVRTGFIVSAALITAGAAGNIFDCLFYGVVFNNPFPPQVASFLPPDGGYSTWCEGRVVDMLYFPLFDINIAGHSWEFFQYIFNIADASICVGVFMLIIFYSKDFALAWEYITSQRKSE